MKPNGAGAAILSSFWNWTLLIYLIISLIGWDAS